MTPPFLGLLQENSCKTVSFMTPRPSPAGCSLQFASSFIPREVPDRIEDEHARPLLSQYLETAGRGAFISCEEARKEWELECASGRGLL